MENFVRPDLPSKCTWHVGSDQKNNPHSKRPIGTPPKISNNILEVIGNTPLIRLNKIPKSEGIKCEILVKCEFLNPGGSVKDRIGYRMVLDAEEAGLIKPGSTLIEPTSGNTGIGIAMASAVKGYNCIIVMPEKMSNEKVNVLRALGAKIVRTPTAASFDSPEGLIAVAQRLNKEIPNSYILDQYRNSGNPLAHYDSTCAEIIEQCEGKIDMIVAGAGTGGTLTGLGRRLKEFCPECTLVAADPEGSILAEPAELNKTDVSFYEVEGIGYDFIPTVLDRSVVDKWIKINDQDSLPMARRLIKEEGLLCGGSSGSAMVAALKAAKSLKEGQRCVVLLPDNIRNYLSKFVSDQWMAARNFIEDDIGLWWSNLKVTSLSFEVPLSIQLTVTCQEAINILKKHGYDQLPVIDTKGGLLGMVTHENLMIKLVNSSVKPSDTVEKVLLRQFSKVSIDAPLGRIYRILEKDPFVLVTQNQNSYSSTDSSETREIVIGIVTVIDLLNFITKNGERNGTHSSENEIGA